MGASQRYWHRKRRRFIHVFFVPLIPISASTEHIKCDVSQSYKPSVLVQPTAV